MSEYNDSAELLEGGLPVDTVDVWLRHSVDPRSGLGSWNGRVKPSPVSGDWSNVDGIRLDDGRVGQIILSNIKVTSGAGPAKQAANIVGSGDPPFDTD